MPETSIPLTHIQLWVSILAIFVTIFIASAGAAWVGVKLAMKPMAKEIESIKDSQKERKEAIRRIERDLQDRVMITFCGEQRVLCSQNRTQSTCAMEQQVNRLTAAIEKQDEKRQEAVKENADMFSKIQSEVAVLSSVAAGLSRHSESLETLIRDRQNDFRPSTMGDKAA
jgi:hypothetical protein